MPPFCFCPKSELLFVFSARSQPGLKGRGYRVGFLGSGKWKKGGAKGCTEERIIDWKRWDQESRFWNTSMCGTMGKKGLEDLSLIVECMLWM